MRFKFLFGHKTAAWKPRPPESTRTTRILLNQVHDETLLNDFDEGNDDVTAIRSSLGLSDTRRPTSE